MKIKIRLDWKKFAVFLAISAGLVYLNLTLLMSAGVLILLFVVDALIANY